MAMPPSDRSRRAVLVDRLSLIFTLLVVLGLAIGLGSYLLGGHW
jgi:hypothetical protein